MDKEIDGDGVDDQEAQAMSEKPDETDRESQGEKGSALFLRVPTFVFFHPVSALMRLHLENLLYPRSLRGRRHTGPDIDPIPILLRFRA